MMKGEQRARTICDQLHDVITEFSHRYGGRPTTFLVTTYSRVWSHTWVLAVTQLLGIIFQSSSLLWRIPAHTFHLRNYWKCIYEIWYREVYSESSYSYFGSYLSFIGSHEGRFERHRLSKKIIYCKMVW